MAAGVRTESKRRAPASPGPLITTSTSICLTCSECVRSCPVKAIRVLEDRAEIIQEKCIACGQCVSACAKEGFGVRDDTDAVIALLRSGRPVVALLATEFVAALHPLTVGQVDRALATLGFSAVETTLLGEEIVAAEYERLHARKDSLLSLRSTCPVVVDFVRTYHPSLTGALAPIVPPYIAQGRLIRALYPEDAAVVYVSPCYARKDEYRQPQFDGVIDAVIDFTELRRMIASAEQQPVRARSVEPAFRRPSVLKEISLTDGFPRATVFAEASVNRQVHVVRGLDDLDRLLCAIERGETAPAIVDMLNCEGCIDGPAVSPGLSLFAKRNVEMVAYDMPGITRVSTRALLGVMPGVDTVRSFTPRPLKPTRASAADVDRSLREGGFPTRADVLDCGACGYETCVEHAEAVLRGDSAWTLCLPLQKRRLSEAVAANAELQAVDALTGLWNAHAFSERFALEMARFSRYGSPLSLLLIDIDGHPEGREPLSELGGGAVLKAFGDLLSAELRRTDVTARLHGDLFAVLLPGIGKTAAFAVAEKLRSALKERPLAPVPEGVPEGYTPGGAVTVCIGVAAAGGRVLDAEALIAAADAALAEARGAGGDEVRLAAN